MEVLVAASSGAIAGLITGVIGSLIAPWVQWAIEKRRSRLGYRQERIRIWRENINSYRGNFTQFTTTATHSEIRPHLTEDVRKRLEKPRTAIVPNEKRGKAAQRYILLDEVARIEKEWGLV
jgi:hypothetical protein